VDFEKLVQLTVNGLTLGSVYALVALGFSMVYGILKLLNFAHGDVMMVGAFVGWGTLNWLGGAESPSVAVWVLITLLVCAAMAACGVLGVVIERSGCPSSSRTRCCCSTAPTSAATTPIS
jgi:branched-chain amino acid transport system permease protein